MIKERNAGNELETNIQETRLCRILSRRQQAQKPEIRHVESESGKDGSLLKQRLGKGSRILKQRLGKVKEIVPVPRSES
jgi:hypothetical protein